MFDTLDTVNPLKRRALVSGEHVLLLKSALLGPADFYSHLGAEKVIVDDPLNTDHTKIRHADGSREIVPRNRLIPDGRQYPAPKEPDIRAYLIDAGIPRHRKRKGKVTEGFKSCHVRVNDPRPRDYRGFYMVQVEAPNKYRAETESLLEKFARKNKMKFELRAPGVYTISRSPMVLNEVENR